MNRPLRNAWQVVVNSFGDRCVIPLDDLREHDRDGVCWCNPVDDGGVIVHRSADRREEYEPGRKAS